MSAYRKNLRALPEGRHDPHGYMKRGLDLLDRVLTAFPIFDEKARRSPKSGGAVWAPVDEAICMLRFMADYTEYYDKYFERLIKPVVSVAPR